MWTITTDGDAGDACFAASIIQELTGGPHIYLVKQNTTTTLRSPETVQRFIKVMKPLMEIQPYIKDFGIYEGGHIDWDSAGFRALGLHYSGISLLDCHARHLQMTKGFGGNIRGTRQWLYVEPSMETKGLVVVNRTSRYNNPYFPWQEIVKFYRGRILFIGLKHEHEAFCSQFGKVSWRQTSDMLEMARLIAGCQLFIGNQSSANALCEGLKQNLIQETCLHIPDCIFRRPNAQHVASGAVVLPGFDKADLHIPCPIKPVVRRDVVPRDCWQYPGCVPDKIFNNLVIKVMRAENIDKKTAEDKIADYNLSIKPEFFGAGNYSPVLATFNLALQNAV